ncbi:MAG TPA: ferric reductase-like transmembrane domain-containing protein [Gaiellales bacterium]|nr:ferric reductase-like transmembrane domain-containing protein [Gaiellales bacterium]
MARADGGRGVSASHVAWYTVRASGYTALVLLTLSMVLGLLLSLNVKSARWPRFLTNHLHGFTTLVALVFLAIHLVATVLDPFMHFGLAGALVPFASGYRTLGMAAGIVAAYLMLAVWITSRLQRRIGWRTWRTLHYAVFAIYALSIAHTLVAGEDATTAWGRWIVVGSVVLVAALTALRALGGRPVPAKTAEHGA